MNNLKYEKAHPVCIKYNHSPFSKDAFYKYRALTNCATGVPAKDAF